MLRRENEGISWLEFELLADVPDLVHGVFLRHGGVSQGPYKSLNVGRSGLASFCGGNEDIRENRFRIQKILGVDHFVEAFQVHGASLLRMDEQQREIPHCDGLMTQQRDLSLLIKHADCQACIFYDPENKALANVHCGWRGNVQNIYGVTVAEMQKQFGSKPDNLLVGISPSLGPKRSEFINYRSELPDSFLPYQIQPTYFDLWAISQMQLEQAGVLPHHIEIASICTYSNPEDFFSFRRDNRVTGNHATVALLRS